MTYSVERLSSDLDFGVVVRDIDASHIESAEVRAHLEELWFSHGLLVFKCKNLTEQFHLDLSRVFGELEVHRSREFHDGEVPELIKLSSGGDRTELEVEGVVGTEWQGWHKDLVYADRINRGGLLRSLKQTTWGGLTGFIDLVGAYKSLPDRLKEEIEGLRVVYLLSLHDQQPYSTRREVKIVRQSSALRSLFSRRDRDYPPVTHPLVFTMPETGEKVLNYSPGHAMCIEGIDEEVGDRILREISEHTFECSAYHHRWSPEDLLLWDNWRMLHTVSMAPLDEVRIMQRTTIGGDYGQGRPAVLPDGHRIPSPLAMAGLKKWWEEDRQR